MGTFKFRLIEMEDGSQVIDTTMETPYKSLTLLDFIEYVETENSIAHMERIKRAERRKKMQANRCGNIVKRLISACGVF